MSKDYKKYPPDPGGINWGCLGTALFWTLVFVVAITIVKLVT